MLANEQNLIPLNKRTKKEQRKIQSKGGTASAEARRERKTMREYAEFLMGLEVKDSRKFNALVRAGVPVEGCDNKMLMVFALMKMAQSGDVAAVKEMRSILGENKSDTGENGQLEELIRGLKNDD